MSADALAGLNRVSVLCRLEPSEPFAKQKRCIYTILAARLRVMNDTQLEIFAAAGVLAHQVCQTAATLTVIRNRQVYTAKKLACPKLALSPLPFGHWPLAH